MECYFFRKKEQFKDKRQPSHKKISQKSMVRSLNSPLLNLSWILSILQYQNTFRPNPMIQIEADFEFECKADLFDELLRESTHNSSPWPLEDQPQNMMIEEKQMPSTDQNFLNAPKLVEQPKSKQGGCSCKRSACLKNYCPCHRDGNKCNNTCSCSGCKNTQFIPKRLQFTMGSFSQFSSLPFTI